jgi:hypothetical protein
MRRHLTWALLLALGLATLAAAQEQTASIVARRRLPLLGGRRPRRRRSLRDREGGRRQLDRDACYIHKQLDRVVEDMGLRNADGEFVWRIANPRFGIASSFVPEGGTSSIAYPRARRDYDAIEIGAEKRRSGSSRLLRRSSLQQLAGFDSPRSRLLASPIRNPPTARMERRRR